MNLQFIDSNSQLLTEIPKTEISGSDASGQMKGKLIEIKNLLEAGFEEIILMNLTKKGNLSPLIKDRKGNFTRFF